MDEEKHSTHSAQPSPDRGPVEPASDRDQPKSTADAAHSQKQSEKPDSEAPKPSEKAESGADPVPDPNAELPVTREIP